MGKQPRSTPKQPTPHPPLAGTRLPPPTVVLSRGRLCCGKTKSHLHKFQPQLQRKQGVQGEFGRSVAFKGHFVVQHDGLHLASVSGLWGRFRTARAQRQLLRCSSREHPLQTPPLQKRA